MWGFQSRAYQEIEDKRDLRLQCSDEPLQCATTLPQHPPAVLIVSESQDMYATCRHASDHDPVHMFDELCEMSAYYNYQICSSLFVTVIIHACTCVAVM